MSLKDSLMRLPGARELSSMRTKLIAHHFDWRYNVKTCGDEDPQQLTVVGENLSHAIPYVPTTPQIGRHMLADRPVADVSPYTFIDMGSGKGRMLLLAAELPFRRIIGVEFATGLHEIARANVQSYRNSKQACFDIQSQNLDAAAFVFPPEPLFLYLFYPFGQLVMEPVIRNLDRSLSEHPRDVIVLYRNPVFSGVIESANNLGLFDKRTYFGSAYHLYRSH